MLHLFLCAFVLCIATQLGAQVANPPQTTQTRLDIDANTGAISALTHSGRDFLANAAPRSLYVIELADPAAWIRSEEATSIEITSAPGNTTLLKFTHDKPIPLTVRCRIHPDATTDFLLGNISISSEKTIRLASVTFPVVSIGLPMSGTGQNDRVVLPECDGSVFVDPLTNGISRDLNYPGGASMQFMAAYDDLSGVYLAARDGDGHSKILSAKRRDKSLDLSIRHFLPQVGLTYWSLPYDVALTTFDTNGLEGWQHAADLYRPWAIQQSWCRQTLKQRVDTGDVPRWLIEPSLFYAFALTGQKPSGGSGQRISLVPEHANAWRDTLGGPVTFMLMSWEKQGPWVAPDYFPPVGDAPAFSAVTKALHDAGHRTLVFLSGLNWTLEKTARGPHPAIDNKAEFVDRGAPHAITLPDGKPAIYGKPAEDVGQYARICPTTPLADELIASAVAKCQDFGIDCVQADQLVGGGSPACFNTAHPHIPGGGNWSAKALYQLFARAREQGKARTRDFAFSIEEPGEFFIPVLDTYHARDYQQNRWPRWGQGVVGVPLFTHVYHDYLHGYGGDSAAVTTGPNDVALYHQAMNLICGKAPAVCAWAEWKDPAAVDPPQQQMLRNHFDLWRGEAGQFLIFGRRVTTADIPSPSMDITFTDWPSRNQRILTVPAVLQSTWELPDGRRATLFACIARNPVTLTIANKPITLSPGQTHLQELPTK